MRTTEEKPAWIPPPAATPSTSFLTQLAVNENVSTSTQNQARSALLFLYRHVIGRDVGDLGEVIRARKPKRLPLHRPAFAAPSMAFEAIAEVLCADPHETRR